MLFVFGNLPFCICALSNTLAKETQAVANYGNICAGLDVLNFLLGVMVRLFTHLKS